MNNIERHEMDKIDVHDLNESTYLTNRSMGQIILDIIDTIVRRRRFLALFITGSTLIAIGIALVSPKWYKATASVFPAEQADLLSGLQGVSSLVRTFGGGGLASLGRPSEIDRYIAILKSDQVLVKVAEKFDLTRVYDITSYPREKTKKELLSNVQYEVTDEGALVINVYDKDPVRAAEMANYFVDVLNETNSQLHAQNAHGNRIFIEQRYNKNLTDIRSAEESLKAFQLKHGVFAVPEQTEASIKTAAELVGRLSVREVELSAMRRTLGEDHPDVVSMRIEVEEMQRRLRQMNTGERGLPNEMKILIPFRQAPELAMEYLRLYRETEIQYKILQFITPLYEQAKVEENRNTPSVVILDRATVPERKAKPKILLFALLAFISSTVIALFFVFISEGLTKLKSLNSNRWERLVSSLRSDWFGLKPSKN